MRLAKFAIAAIGIMAAMALFVMACAALIGGQWAVIFGALDRATIESGLAWIAAGLIGGALLQFAAIRLLASEPPWSGWWIVGAMVPIMVAAWHYGMLILAMIIAPVMVFHTRRQVKDARAKAAPEAVTEPAPVRQLWS